MSWRNSSASVKGSRLLPALALSMWLAPGLTPLASAEQAANPWDSVGYYTYAYGESQPEDDANVARAFEVFERVRASADVNGLHRTRLVVTADTPDSSSAPWAVALPDGHIILSRRAVEICHLDANRAVAEARLAFVIGHELAHLAHDDFLHRRVFALAHKPVPYESLPGDPGLELAADDKGFVFAAMAGYPVQLLLEEPDFFEFWMQQTTTGLAARHADAIERGQALRNRLSDLQRQLVFFDFGLRLSHFGNCHDGVHFLRTLQQSFPGRAVLNNIGFCYLQLAHQAMDSEFANLYWMPFLLDNDTRLRGLTRTAPATLKSLREAAATTGRGFLLEAIAYFEQAAQVDTAYLPARLNLGMARLYLGQPHKARAALTEALQLAPENATVRGLDALALYEQSEPGLDLWPQAVERLKAIAGNAKPSVPPEILFNLARLLELRALPEEASQYWALLSEQRASLPGSVRQISCAAQRRMPAEECMRRAKPTQANAGWTWPVSAMHGFAATGTKANWRVFEFDYFEDQLRGQIYQNPEATAEVLVLDGTIQMQVLKGTALGQTDDLEKYCGQSPGRRELPGGTLWNCGDWSALTWNNRVLEVWRVAR